MYRYKIYYNYLISLNKVVSCGECSAYNATCLENWLQLQSLIFDLCTSSFYLPFILHFLLRQIAIFAIFVQVVDFVPTSHQKRSWTRETNCCWFSALGGWCQWVNCLSFESSLWIEWPQLKWYSSPELTNWKWRHKLTPVATRLNISSLFYIY